jgi:hypothetical protein
MNRDQAEAHLTLRGWLPSTWGQGGATRNDVVVFTSKTKVWEVGADDPSPRFNVHVIWGQEPHIIAKHELDVWLWSDPLFWRIANECLSLDACQHSCGRDMSNLAAWRCASCHQIL